MFHLKKSEDKIQTAHLVYITDEEGIFDAFMHAKKELISNASPSLSFIYAYSSEFSKLQLEQELNFLEKQFSQNLLVYKIPVCTDTNCLSKEFQEALINSNISGKMKFFLFGNDEFVTYFSKILSFLGIKSFVITNSLICLM